MASDASSALAVRQQVQNFLNAAQTGNLDLLKKLAMQLDEGKGMAKTVADVKDANKRTALHFAAREGRIEVCKFLVEELKLDVNVKDEDGETPLLHASRQGHFQTAKYLLEQGADPSASSELGTTPLHHAAGIGNIELLKLLLSKGVDVESQSDAGTPLIWAAGHGQQEAVKVLLEQHANRKLLRQSSPSSSKPFSVKMGLAVEQGSSKDLTRFYDWLLTNVNALIVSAYFLGQEMGLA